MTTDEIVKRLRSFTKGNDALEHEAADRLEALEAEVGRLREALEEIAGASWGETISGLEIVAKGLTIDKARAALKVRNDNGRED
jgi:hypothetical protein